MAALGWDPDSQSVLDSLLHEVAVLDGDGMIVAVNRAWREFCPEPGEQLVGRGPGTNYLDVCARSQGPGSADAVRVLVGIQSVLEGDVPCFQHVYPCGTPTANLWFSMTATPMTGPGGRCAVLVHEDVTLRQDVMRRLALARDEAQRANQAKSHFVASLSHELRTPLNAIGGFAELLERDSKHDSEREALGEIRKAGNFMTQLLDDVLDLSRVEAGHVELVTGPVAVLPLLRRCEQLMQPAAAAAGIRLRLHDDPDMAGARVLADERRLQQILLNLLSNAIKYNRASGRVDISLESAQPARWRLHVSDTGYGIPAQRRAEVFAPFQRLGQGGGTAAGAGLGLAISRRLAEAMNGSLDFVSRPGQGCTFSVMLPDAGRDESAGTPHAGVDAEPDELKAAGARTVLYLEDNPANLKFVQRVLEARTDLRFVGLDDPDQFMEQVRTHQPDLVLMDISLPGCSGVDMLQQLREDLRFAEVPVLALSANAMRQDVEKGLAAGFRRYLTKPINVGDLLDALDAELS